MTIFSAPFDKSILIEMQKNYFGDMVKGVVDVKKNLLAVDADLENFHSRWILED